MLITGKVGSGKSTKLLRLIIEKYICPLKTRDLKVIENFIDEKFFGYITLSRLNYDEGAGRLFYLVDIRTYLKYFFRNNLDVLSDTSGDGDASDDCDACNINERILIERLGKDLKDVDRGLALKMSSAELFPPKSDVNRKMFIAAIREKLSEIYAEIGEGGDKVLVMDETMGIEMTEPEVRELLEGIQLEHRGESFLVCKSDEHRAYLQSFILES